VSKIESVGKMYVFDETKHYLPFIVSATENWYLKCDLNTTKCYAIYSRFFLKKKYYF
jgi:hypothetical protein